MIHLQDVQVYKNGGRSFIPSSTYKKRTRRHQFMPQCSSLRQNVAWASCFYNYHFNKTENIFLKNGLLNICGTSGYPLWNLRVPKNIIWYPLKHWSFWWGLKGSGDRVESQNINIRFLQAICNLFGEFILNLVTTACLSGSFPTFKMRQLIEFQKHQIQWQQYHPACFIVRFRKKIIKILYYKQRREYCCLP